MHPQFLSFVSHPSERKKPLVAIQEDKACLAQNVKEFLQLITTRHNVNTRRGESSFKLKPLP